MAEGHDADSQRESRRHRTAARAEAIGSMVGHTLTRTAGSIRRVVGFSMPALKKAQPGTAPGIEQPDLERMADEKPPPRTVHLSCIDYSPDQVLIRDIIDEDEFLAHHRPEWAVVRWINVDGLTDLHIIHALAEKYDLHPLAIEDVLHLPQRPKVDAYGGDNGQRARLFLIARMIQVEAGVLHREQISIFLGHNTVITIQEDPGDVWDPIRQRINKPGSRLRQNDASFLVYALLDAIVDHCFPILEHYSEQLVALEEQVLDDPTQESMHEIHRLRRELLLLRREVWPMREVVHTLQRERHECMGDNTRVYLRDVYDHAVQIIEIIETYRELAMGMTEAYMTAVSNRMNEAIKVLTLIATIFIPITFLAGVYGMNMPIPENQWWWSYPAFWIACVLTASGMVLWFKRRGWL